MERIKGLVNPALFHLLDRCDHLHVDASFYICPRECSQILKIMVHNEQTESHVKTLVMLGMTGKYDSIRITHATKFLLNL